MKEEVRTVVYAVSSNALYLFDTLSYAIAQEMKAQGYEIKTRLVTRKHPKTKMEKEFMTKRFKALANKG